MHSISIFQLTKTYGLARGKRKTAVDSLDLEVRVGEIFGFLGPNGAGKTSTIKMLLGFIRPTSGRAEILGVPVDDPQARAAVGYLPEQPYFHKFMTPTEVVSMHAALIGIPRKERRDRVNDVIETVGLQELARNPISKMSKGQVQRVGLAQAILGDPKVLILDEPASGLDPMGRRHVRDLLMKQKEAGRTVFLSSHLLSEIENVCDRVAVLSKGHLVALGTPDEIKEQEPQMAIRTARISSELASHIRELGGHAEYSEGDTIITVDSSHVYIMIDLLREQELPLISVAPARESLEDAFLRLAA